jgi:hypothetical protein
MSGEEISTQITVCVAAKGTKGFAPAVETLLNMLPLETRTEVEAVDGVYNETETCVNRFINMVLITVEFVTIRTLDHEAAFAVIQAHVK